MKYKLKLFAEQNLHVIWVDGELLRVCLEVLFTSLTYAFFKRGPAWLEESICTSTANESINKKNTK